MMSPQHLFDPDAPEQATNTVPLDPEVSGSGRSP